MSIEQAILKEMQALPPEKQREIYEHARRLRAETTKKPRLAVARRAPLISREAGVRASEIQTIW